MVQASGGSLCPEPGEEPTLPTLPLSCLRALSGVSGVLSGVSGGLSYKNNLSWAGGGEGGGLCHLVNRQGHRRGDAETIWAQRIPELGPAD